MDSSALFFLLEENKVSFDIAIINYNTRDNSKKELEYAKSLAKKYDKNIFIKNVKLENISNFEKKARDIRYTFFEKIIEKYNYEILITAHQLNDKLEWFLMQLSLGAGLVELIGLNTFEKKQTYTIYKPLLNLSKKELETYLLKNKYKYFIDKSNFDEKYRRNYFRHNFSEKFLNEYKNGIIKSFEYLNKDLKSLKLNTIAKYKKYDLEIFENLNDNNLNIRIIDISLKKRGVLLSKAQRDEILKQKNITISDKINISIDNKYIFIVPKVKITMTKEFKEKCRIKKIPENIRPYIFSKNIDLEEMIKTIN